MKTDMRRAGDLPRIRWAVYALLLAMPVAFVAGRATDPSRFTIRQAEAAPVPRDLPFGVARFHDASNEVTCWQVGGSGLSCLPDQWLASARIDDTP